MHQISVRVYLISTVVDSNVYHLLKRLMVLLVPLVSVLLVSLPLLDLVPLVSLLPLDLVLLVSLLVLLVSLLVPRDSVVLVDQEPVNLVTALKLYCMVMIQKNSIGFQIHKTTSKMTSIISKSVQEEIILSNPARPIVMI